MSGYSVRSNNDLILTFAAMFPSSKGHLIWPGPNLCMWVNHGLAPYFKSLLKTSIDRSDFFSFSFDESLSEPTSEMDLYVRFWDVSENKVNVCYYGSRFLGHGTHQNLL